MKSKIWIIITVFTVLASCSMNDLDPVVSNEKDIATNISNIEDLQGIANGIYDRMTVTTYYGRNLIIYGEVRADNCFANGRSGRFMSEAAMKVSPDASNGPWDAMYAVIASCNIIIGQDPVTIEGDQQKIKQVTGQAYIARAMAHFDLLRLYGQQHVGGTLGIPYIREYVSGQTAPARNSVDENRMAIFEDIETGLAIMTEPNNPKTKQQISTFAGYALKARVALYFKEWEKAKTAALAVINSGKFSVVDSANFVGSWKTKNNTNSIFELAFSTNDNLGVNGLQNIYRGAQYGDIEVLDNLLTIFDDEDVRKSTGMIGFETVLGVKRLRNLGKYPSADFSDNVALFRIEEQVLILAEAKFELGEADAIEILNLIPAKRGVASYSAITKENILKERRRELCFEGFRFDDLLRTGSDIPLVDPIKQTHGGPEYGSYNLAFPIPGVELNANKNMVQNKDY
ncbi:MAG: RagB/SusD family nutrient uptake outer membrane protein [Draconibacterium sp.]